MHSIWEDLRTTRLRRVLAVVCVYKGRQTVRWSVCGSARHTNMYKSLFIFGAVVVVVSAGVFHQEEHEESHDEHDHYPEYNFEYSVHDPHHHDIKSHQESRHGDVVKGYYSLIDADGSLREVHYTADKKNGYQAIVTKNGVQVFPQVDGGAQHTEGQSEDEYSHSHDTGSDDEFSSYSDESSPQTEESYEHHYY